LAKRHREGTAPWMSHCLVMRASRQRRGADRLRATPSTLEPL
jgi:hypothetical protein